MTAIGQLQTVSATVNIPRIAVFGCLVAGLKSSAANPSEEMKE
jgi:hypothetical protein